MDEMDSDHRQDDAQLRAALAPSTRQAERIARRALQGGSRVPGAGRDRRSRQAWIAAGSMAAAGLVLGLWLSAARLDSTPGRLIANHGSVYLLRSPQGESRLLNGAALTAGAGRGFVNEGSVRAGQTMVLLHGGSR